MMRTDALRPLVENPGLDIYRLVVESVRDYAIFMLDPTGVVMTWNRGAEVIKGWRADEIIGRHFSAFYPPEDLAARKPDRELQEAERVGRLEDEGWRLRKDGTRFWANVVITALRDDAGRLVGFAKVTRDLTERRRAEETRTQLARAEEALHTRDEFLVLLSHELRNPLAPMGNALYILEQSPHDSETARRAREIIRRQYSHLCHVVQDLLDASRLSRGKTELRLEPVELREFVTAAAEDHQGVFEAAGLSLEISTADAEVWTTIDRVRMSQVLANLLSNARKFTPRGGCVRVSVDARAATATVRVSDDGDGMDAGLVRRVFELFVQGPQSLARKEGGLGLGLAVVKGIVELHGGTVDIRSDGPGAGTEVSFVLPATAPPAQLFPHDDQAPASRSSRKVLVVDDNVDAAESLAELLRLLGHSVSVAFDGRAAIRAALADPPGVVLCDLGLPGASGFEVASALRGDPLTSRALLIAVTGYSAAEDVARSRAAGFDRHLTKPPDPAELARLIA